MANIRQQGKLILAHPFFKECLSKAVSGDFSDFDRLLYELHSHCWEKCALEASRVYGNWHKANHMDIKRELRHMPPPETLDLHLPIPGQAPPQITFQPELQELDFMLDTKATEQVIIPLTLHAKNKIAL